MLLIAMIAALAMIAAACGEDTEEGATEDEPAEEEPAEDEETEEDASEDEEDAASGDGGEIGMAWIPWEENLAVAHMWEAILEEEGYDVTPSQYDVAPAFASVANSEEDLFLDMWLPATHASYEEEFGDQLEDLGVWFDEATLELTVPSYVEEVDTLEDLAENPEMFDGQITGIEAGAGMMELLINEVAPGYGLDEDFEIVESSTAAMRAELANAIEEEEPIVVTLWTPHPEYGLKDLKRLEDPQGLWGEAEQLHAVGRPGFAEDFPEVAEWIENWEMTDEELSSINAAIDEADEGEWADVASQWVEDNRDLVDGWLGN